jgi:hypothetical protein
MSINLKIEGMIHHIIFITRHIAVWDDYKNEIINNINDINFYNKIENYIPCGRNLYVSKPRMRKILYDSIVLNDNIFVEVGYNSYKPREQYDIEYKDIYAFIEECIKILIKKQQLK